MKILRGFEKKYLRGLAHDMRPLVLIGKEGLTDGIVRAVEEGLALHELIKIKFNDFKLKELKVSMTDDMIARTGSVLVGTIGHTAIVYREQADPARRKITLPKK
jgi:RNA-binding protein